MRSLNFGQDSPRDHFDQLVESVTRLKNSPTEIGLGQQAAINAWSLTEWVFLHEPEFCEGSLTQYANEVKTLCPELALLQDICNAKKHTRIDRYTPKVKNTERSGGFSRAFSRSFKQAGLYVIDAQEGRFLLDDLLDAAVAFWSNRLSDLEL
ncbi:hypothetical protein [Phaeobacter sp. NW0010-22]|uniref:hypothetical protein n=1 Tax=Phaeobacter sp. NW0010-22 TaxID=3135907 RepID=UPI003106B305